jgi:hypothetical protein
MSTLMGWDGVSSGQTQQFSHPLPVDEVEVRHHRDRGYKRRFGE